MLNTTFKVARRFLAAHSAPRWMELAVKNGELDEKVLVAWKEVASVIENHFNSGSALTYWQTKCRQIGIRVPASQVEEGEDEEYRVRPDDRVEDWQHQNRRSEGMLQDVRRIEHTLLQEAKHLKDEKLSASIIKILEDLDDTLDRYDLHGSPAISFEKEFQFVLLLEKKELSKNLLRYLEADGTSSHEDDLKDWLYVVERNSIRLSNLLTKAGA